MKGENQFSTAAVRTKTGLQIWAQGLSAECAEDPYLLEGGC